MQVHKKVLACLVIEKKYEREKCLSDVLRRAFLCVCAYIKRVRMPCVSIKTWLRENQFQHGREGMHGGNKIHKVPIKSNLIDVGLNAKRFLF